MGNASGSSLPFEIANSVEFDKSDCKLHTGYKKDGNDKKEEVLIFKFSKNPGDINAFTPAQRNTQKLRTIRHPFILSYIDSTELDDSLLLVTEYAMPLSSWIKTQKSSISPSSGDNEEMINSRLTSEVVWGLRCLLDALDFLHTTCNMTHGYIGYHAIFVCKNGDWKIGSLDLLSNFNNKDDRLYYKSRIHIVEDKYMSPERKQFRSLTSQELDMLDPSMITSQGSADIYALGMVIQQTLDTLNLTPTATISRCLKKMYMSEYKKRPTAKQTLSLITTQSNFLTQLNELAIKTPGESVDILNQLSEHLNDIPVSASHFKVIPSISKVLNMAFNDFRNRDAREPCRQAIQACLNLLSALATETKLESTIYNEQCSAVMGQLWTMSDRSIRTALLRTLQQLAPYTSESMINKTIFEPLLSGFSDTNAKMREETLKSLVWIVDKLDEKNLQDKLVRAIMNIQADAEASIRTNAVIFIGRIANKLKEPIRVRVLSTSLIKALKDPFIHCRLAGLKATQACLKMIDITQLSTKLLPHICTLCLDRHMEIRQLSISLIENSLSLIKDNHEVMKVTAEKEKLAKAQQDASAESGSTASTTDSSMWNLSSQISTLSWSAVDGLTKTLEKTIIATANTVDEQSGSTSGNNTGTIGNNTTGKRMSMNDSIGNIMMSPTMNTSGNTDFPSFTSPTMKISQPIAATAPTSSTSVVSSKKVADAWDDDDFGDDFDNDNDHDDNNDDDTSPNNNSSSSQNILTSSSSGGGGMKLSTTSTAASGVGKKNAWDDDDFDDDMFDSKPVKTIVSVPTDKTTIASSSSSYMSDTTTTTTVTTPPIIPKKTISSSSSSSSTTITSKPTTSKTATVKKAVTKLSVDKNENWDDF